MTLKTIFHKPVDRPIEGVIKADDEASLRLEIEEYVLTNEVEKRLESFLDAYNNYEGANGVWVSGFFGSGKSHLLKMLALLLENRQIDGVTALELFLPKCGENEILRGDLNRAVKIPSKSILFNIDQKADVISKTQIDALLAVFVKVFDETCGYYGKQGHIAQFERDLDSRDLYEPFKTAYQTLAGKSWHKGREQALLEAKNIAKAYAEVTSGDETAALGILDKYRSQYRVSIEDFAEQVSAYIERQPAEFRLNFFVDEVGQYVADNVKLMTNLQTIAESLATKCRGRAWVIVTAQEDMATVVGEMGKQQSNDFSKIQARFANRMKLTSADVAEVIQKRLLMKNEEGVQLLGDIYHAQANNFKTLFDFADGSQTYRNFQDRDHFIHGYPFIPYQFALFQSAIQNLSQHNAFEGKHSSVGERSMLGVFQQVAIQIGNHQIGQLATFDLMFEGIRTALKANTQRAILLAEKQLDNTLAIRLLKALFLVKYVKAFKPSLRNLCVLMLEAFNQDLPGLRKKVEEALNLLEQQTYIQRNGELYEYLTDEEKDVEEEIKNTEVESNDVAAELEKLVFDHVIKNKKIRYDDNGQDYPFTRKLDERLFGRESELCIHIISPFHEFADNQASLVMHSFGRDELLVVMPPDDRLVRDILMYKRTEKYIRQNISITQQEAIKRILTDKGFQNRERYDDLLKRVQTLLGKSKLYVAGNEIEIGVEDAQSRLIKGFHELITRTYSNLRMLRGITYTENDIAQCLKASQDGIFGNDVAALAESEQELLAFIQSNNRGGVRTTVKSLLEKFERKPYGWYFAAVLCTLASLCARGKVEMRVDGNLLEENELERALRNTHGHGNLVLEPQVEFTASQIRALKEFYEDFFDTPPRASEAKALGSETAEAFQQLTQQLSSLKALVSQYPFLSALNPVLDKLKELNGKPYIWYLTELARQEDSLLAMKESVIDPIRKFMSGPQKGIFDDAHKFVQTQEPNFAYVESDEASQIFACLTDPECFKGNRMQQIKAQVETLQEKVNTQITVEIAQAKEAVAALKDRMCGMSEFGRLNAEQQEHLAKPFNEFSNAIERQPLIAVIRDTLRRFEESDYQRQLSQMTTWAQPAPIPKPASGPDGTSSSETGMDTKSPAKTEPRIEYVVSRAVKVSFDKAWLADEADVERYLESMREALLEEIRKGKRIQI
ncbi:BREX system P-loop protein BrxC [Methylomonas sp. OY6]|uniref:BREX system P-loop protein BrxC n=1 Tax=Methylomonas defluvii TaxID=3045149 RepID=A0ABU4UBN6_9GAMM|nr:BREX system P-loop protein BrxC [Methylomonas sp. OY6]MDX8126780.1 BREX system P-loop protein BrxC [Methylomonas sp. OY6]